MLNWRKKALKVFNKEKSEKKFGVFKKYMYLCSRK